MDKDYENFDQRVERLNKEAAEKKRQDKLKHYIPVNPNEAKTLLENYHRGHQGNFAFFHDSDPKEEKTFQMIWIDGNTSEIKSARIMIDAGLVSHHYTNSKKYRFFQIKTEGPYRSDVSYDFLDDFIKDANQKSSIFLIETAYNPFNLEHKKIKEDNEKYAKYDCSGASPFMNGYYSKNREKSEIEKVTFLTPTDLAPYQTKKTLPDNILNHPCFWKDSNREKSTEILSTLNLSDCPLMFRPSSQPNAIAFTTVKKTIDDNFQCVWDIIPYKQGAEGNFVFKIPADNVESWGTFDELVDYYHTNYNVVKTNYSYYFPQQRQVQSIPFQFGNQPNFFPQIPAQPQQQGQLNISAQINNSNQHPSNNRFSQ